jgi:hypothetical protein
LNSHLVVRKRIQVTLSGRVLLEDIASRFVVIPLNARIAARAVELLSTYPSDPMDRIIGARALVEGLELVSADENIRRSKVLPTIWWRPVGLASLLPTGCWRRLTAILLPPVTAAGNPEMIFMLFGGVVVTCSLPGGLS